MISVMERTAQIALMSRRMMMVLFGLLVERKLEWK